MNVQSSDYGHFVSIEDTQTGEEFHFVVGKSKSLRYLGGRDARTGNTPAQSSRAYADAEAKAIAHFQWRSIL